VQIELESKPELEKVTRLSPPVPEEPANAVVDGEAACASSPPAPEASRGHDRREAPRPEQQQQQ